MNIVVKNKNTITIPINGLCLTIETIKWESGKTTYHLYFDGDGKLFNHYCMQGNEIRLIANHLIFTDVTT